MHTRAGIEQLKIRIPKKLARELETLAKIEQVAKVDLALQLPWEGGARRKQEVVLKLHEQRQVSKSRTAETTGLSLWEFTELVEQRSARWDYNLEDVKLELQQFLTQA